MVDSGDAMRAFDRKRTSPEVVLKKRLGVPWMPAKDYARSLQSLSVSLIVKDIEASLAFQREILRASVVSGDPDFAVLRGYGAEWMMHADHTYEEHPLGSRLT